MTRFNVLLYYQFVYVQDPAALAHEQFELCKELDLKGRVLVAHEGINGTVSGTVEQCNEYRRALTADPRFSSIVFKVDEVERHVFEKLFVRVKNELVTMRDDEHRLSPMDNKEMDNVKRGGYLEPKEFMEYLQRDDVIIIDGRTDYEYDLGHFRNAIKPPLQSFREFPEWLSSEFADAKDKTIITYCTGGIRCEKLTAHMISAGFKDVHQLHGGIVTYGKDPDTKGSLWDGKCYVFDQRISVEINHTPDKRIVGRCRHCNQPTERYVNCANLDCHRQHLTCESCEKRMLRSCSEPCMTAPRREHLV